MSVKELKIERPIEPIITPKQTQAPTASSTLVEKVSKVANKILEILKKVFAAICGVTSALSLAGLMKRYISHKKHGETVEKLAKTRQNVVQEAIKDFKTTNLSESAREHFFNSLPEEEHTFLRARTALLKSPEYKAIKKIAEHVAKQYPAGMPEKHIPSEMIQGVTAKYLPGKNVEEHVRTYLQSTNEFQGVFTKRSQEFETQRSFLGKVNQLQKLIHQKPEGSTHDHMQKVRQKLDELEKDPIYQKFKADESHPAIRLVHSAAHALTAKASGRDELRAYGKKLLGGYKGKRTGIDGLSEALKYAKNKGASFQKDDLEGQVEWSFLHPEKFIASTLFGHSKKYGGEYNSYAHGNANIYLWDLEIGNTTAVFFQGPGPTEHGGTFKMHLQHLKNTDQTHVQYSLEQPKQVGEHERRKMQHKMVGDYFMSTPLDGPAYKGKEQFTHVTDSEDYFNKLENHVMEGNLHREMPENGKEDNGFYFTETMLSDEDLQEAFTTSKKQFAKLEQTQTFKNLTPQQQNKARLAAFDNLVSMKAIANTGKDKVFFGEACKQDIDRGVVLNILKKVYSDSLQGKVITEDTVCELVGMLVIRSAMVDDRAILKDRFEALVAVLDLIAENPEAFFFEVNDYIKQENHKLFAVLSKDDTKTEARDLFPIEGEFEEFVN